MRGTAIALLAGLLAGATSPALATGEIVCSAEDVSVDLLVGRLDVLSVVRAVVTIGDETWSTEPDIVPGTPIAVGQAFEADGVLLVDLTDDAVNEVLSRLRAFSATEGDSSVTGGVFMFKDKGAFVVDCSERG
ncbi:hypothetical protein ABGN05_12660 [Aquibium sp. LZ166]|uniref:Uncharacterized protein n=1 Tax=Aquibium pacificus TaxID=3153579 RepID=A0ABV3SJ49_9HYPH